MEREKYRPPPHWIDELFSQTISINIKQRSCADVKSPLSAKVLNYLSGPSTLSRNINYYSEGLPRGGPSISIITLRVYPVARTVRQNILFVNCTKG